MGPKTFSPSPTPDVSAAVPYDPVSVEGFRSGGSEGILTSDAFGRWHLNLPEFPRDRIWVTPDFRVGGKIFPLTSGAILGEARVKDFLLNVSKG
jgi:hypothetical protein